MFAYECLRCGCIHGWADHPKVTKVERYFRGSMEDCWWCPGCGREHRTTDGTMFGQVQKLWREVDDLSWKVIEEIWMPSADGMHGTIVLVEQNERGERRSHERRW